MCLKYCLYMRRQPFLFSQRKCLAAPTHASTFENSEVGDMTKLSSDWDHEMRCDMFGSSSMLLLLSATELLPQRLDLWEDASLVKLVYKSCLDNFGPLNCSSRSRRRGSHSHGGGR